MMLEFVAHDFEKHVKERYSEALCKLRGNPGLIGLHFFRQKSLGQVD